ncbi:hypothetical protein BGZ92_011814, partial [Podila epicladia]
MRSFISVVVASTLLASTAFASLKSCGSRTNDFVFKSVEYSPSPADPSKPLCFHIRGKVQQPIPSGSNAVISFSGAGISDKYEQVFVQTLEPKIYGDIAEEADSLFKACYFFPMGFQYKKN